MPMPDLSVWAEAPGPPAREDLDGCLQRPAQARMARAELSAVQGLTMGAVK